MSRAQGRIRAVHRARMNAAPPQAGNCECDLLSFDWIATAILASSKPIDPTRRLAALRALFPDWQWCYA